MTPEPDALLISGMCNMYVFECVSLMMCWRSHRGHSKACSMATEGIAAKVKWRTPASAAELELGARACLSEGRAAEGEQKIAQLRETERKGETERTNNRAKISLYASYSVNLCFTGSTLWRRTANLRCLKAFQRWSDRGGIWSTFWVTHT